MTKAGEVDFIGIGAAKSGSSWLDYCLENHPQINIPEDKSLFFFNSDFGNQYEKDNWSHYSKGINWYLKKFAPIEEGKVRGEFGVSYLNDPVACERIKELFPDTKILVTLRNPVDMIYSLYWYAKSTVEITTPDTFEEMVDREIYLDRGKYYKNLKRYYTAFPGKNIHVIVMDDIMNKPEKTIEELYKFLGVDPSFSPPNLYKKVYPAIGNRSVLLKNVGFRMFSVMKYFRLGALKNFILDNPIFYKVYSRLNVVPKKYLPMDPVTRKKLTNYYRKDIEKLEKLIGRDLSAWK
jgi:hypothetical protein